MTTSITTESRRKIAVGAILCIALFAGGQAVYAASLSLEVVDDLGQPIESAAVILRPELQTPVEVPPPFFTDLSGRVLIDGLADGEWQVEVRSEGYMIFSAYLKLASGLPPLVGFTSKQRTGTFWAPLEVRFLAIGVSAETVRAGKKGLARSDRKQLQRVEAEERSSRKREQKEIREAEKRARAQEKRLQVRARRGELAVIAESQEEAPQESVAAVVAAPPALEEVAELEDSPRAADESSEPPVAEPEPTTTAAAQPTTAAAEPTTVVPEPEAPVQVAAVDLPPVPSPQERPREVPTIRSHPVLFHGGACPECKAGEWALIVERRAAPRVGDETDCGKGRAAAVEGLVKGVLLPQEDALAGFAGPLLDSYGSGVAAKLDSPINDAAYRLLTTGTGACQSLVAILPVDARFVGFRFEVVDANGSGDCFGINQCSIGQARWIANPEIERLAAMTVIHTSFLNESTSLPRRARLIVLFVPARGWTAP